MTRLRRFLIPVVLLVLIAVGVGWWLVATRGRAYTAPPPAFDGTSDQLTQTVIVPTLDTPIPDGKSAVWCASFQLAWNRLKDDVAKGPVRLAGGQAVADRLNRGDQTEADIDPADVYAAAGLTGDGIAGRIRTEMARRFPNVPPPDLGMGNAAVAYSYLAAACKFDLPFFENEAFEFIDGAGRKTLVGSFGIRWEDAFGYKPLREQVQILYSPKGPPDPLGIPEFVLDPCRTSRPYQVVIARVDRKPTLAETLADVRQKIVAGAKAEPYRTKFGPNDVLLIPNMAFRIAHRFREVEGSDKPFQNPPLSGLHIETAMQTVEFRLDRSGAELKAESKVMVAPTPRHFLANRPFLVYLTKRDGGNPFFAMWVETAELLRRR